MYSRIYVVCMTSLYVYKMIACVRLWFFRVEHEVRRRIISIRQADRQAEGIQREASSDGEERSRCEATEFW